MSGDRPAEKTGGVLAPEELGASLERVAATTDLDIREGRFQRWLALISALSSALSGVEVAYEHYKGSYSRRVMYTPVILSGALVAGGLSGFFSRRAARTILPAVSVLTLGDCAVGFYFHVRGIQRKPGDGVCLSSTWLWVRQCSLHFCSASAHISVFSRLFFGAVNGTVRDFCLVPHTRIIGREP